MTTVIHENEVMTTSRTIRLSAVQRAADAQAALDAARAEVLAAVKAARESFDAAEAAYRQSIIDARATGASYGDIADACGVSRQSVRVMFERAQGRAGK
jgi:DNA-directed RNA polymerase specialized sigma24 family protein